jgi:glycosyltransferase involved in cell wall biosynthesis
MMPWISHSCEVSMRILILSPNWPFPADNGGKLRAAYVARYLAATHDVAFVCFTNSAKPLLYSLDTDRFREVQGIPLPPLGSQLRRWLSFAPSEVQDFSSGKMTCCLEKLMRQFSPEVLLVGEPALTPYVAHYADRIRVLDYLCVNTLQFERLGALSSGSQRLLWSFRKAKFAAYLRRIAHYYDLCLVNSEEDREALLAAAPAWRNIEFLPNGLDLAAYPLGLASPQPNTLVFPGALTYTPNLDAATYFIHDILPRIRTQAPDVTLLITGQVPPDGSAPQAPGVIYTGYVSDIRPVIAGAWACPVPLRSVAGGARFKVLEALALGPPVGSTAIGVEGIDVKDGTNILMAEDPLAFSTQIVKILRSPELRNQLAQAGRRLVEQQYNWQVLGARVTALAEELVSKRRRRGARGE